MKLPQRTTLNADELSAAIQCVSPKGREYGAARIVRMLAQEHSVHTARINTRCSVGNISDLVSAINNRVAHMGLYIACERPPRQILNQFNQPSGQMLWSFYRDVAANESGYQPESLADALMRDLRALQADLEHGYSAGGKVATGGCEPAVKGAADARGN